MIRHGSLLVESLCHSADGGVGDDEAYLTCVDHSSIAIESNGDGGLLVCGYSDGSIVFYHTHTYPSSGPRQGSVHAEAESLRAGAPLLVTKLQTLSTATVFCNRSAATTKNEPTSSSSHKTKSRGMSSTAAVPVTCLSRSPDGWCLGLGTADGEVALLDLRGSQDEHMCAVEHERIETGGDVIAYISRNKCFPLLASHRGHSRAITSLAWSRERPRSGAGSSAGVAVASKKGKFTIRMKSVSQPESILYSGCKGGRVMELRRKSATHLRSTPPRATPEKRMEKSHYSEAPLSTMLAFLGDNASNFPTPASSKCKGEEYLEAEIFQCSGPIQQLHCGLAEDLSLGSIRLLLISAGTKDQVYKITKSMPHKQARPQAYAHAQSQSQVILLQFPINVCHTPRMRDLSMSVGIGRGACACFLPSSDGVHSTGIVATSILSTPTISQMGGMGSGKSKACVDSLSLQAQILDTDGNVQQSMLLEYKGNFNSDSKVEGKTVSTLPEMCYNLLPVGYRSHTLLLLGGQPSYGSFSLDMLNRQYGTLEPMGKDCPMVVGASIDLYSTPPRVTTLSACTHVPNKDIVTVNVFSCVFSAAFAGTALSGSTSLPRKWLSSLRTLKQYWFAYRARKLTLTETTSIASPPETDVEGDTECVIRISSTTSLSPLVEPKGHVTVVNSAFRLYDVDTDTDTRQQQMQLQSLYLLRRRALACPFPYSAAVMGVCPQRCPTASVCELHTLEESDCLPIEELFIPIDTDLIAGSKLSNSIPIGQAPPPAHPPSWLKETNAKTWLLGWADMGCYMEEKDYPWPTASGQTSPSTTLDAHADTMHISGRHIHAEAFFAFSEKKVLGSRECNSVSQSTFFLGNSGDSDQVLHELCGPLLNVKGRMAHRRRSRGAARSNFCLVQEKTVSALQEEAAQLAASHVQSLPAASDLPASCMFCEKECVRLCVRSKSPSGQLEFARGKSPHDQLRESSREYEGDMFVRINSSGESESGESGEDYDSSPPDVAKAYVNAKKNSRVVPLAPTSNSSVSGEIPPFEHQHPNPHMRRLRVRPRLEINPLSASVSSYVLNSCMKYASPAISSSIAVPLSRNVNYRKPITAASLEEMCDRGVSAYNISTTGVRNTLGMNRNNQTWNDCDGDYFDEWGRKKEEEDGEMEGTWTDIGYEDEEQNEGENVSDKDSKLIDSQSLAIRRVNHVESSRGDLLFEDLMREKYQMESQHLVGGVIVNKKPLPYPTPDENLGPLIVGGRPGSPVLQEQDVPEELFHLVEGLIPMADRMMNLSVRPLAALSSSVLNSFWNTNLPSPTDNLLHAPSYMPSSDLLWNSDLVQMARDVATTALVAPTRDLLGIKNDSKSTGRNYTVHCLSSAAAATKRVSQPEYDHARHLEVRLEQEEFLSRLRRFTQRTHAFPFLAPTSCFAHDEDTAVGRIIESIAAHILQQKLLGLKSYGHNGWIHRSNNETVGFFSSHLEGTKSGGFSQLLASPSPRTLTDVLTEVGLSVGGAVDTPSRRTGTRYLRNERRIKQTAKELLRDIQRSL